ncbi:MAG: hypothetical protein ACR2IF_01800 [Terriglobales bacterium]
MGDRQMLIAELSHQINSPLAAIRNALYLATTHTCDLQVLEYLTLANKEITVIAAILQETRALIESTGTPPPPRVNTVEATRSAAA